MVIGRDAFERAGAGGAHDDAAPCGRAGGVDCAERLRGDVDALGVHWVRVEGFGVDRFEGSGADVEGDRVDRRSACAHGAQELGCEVEAGGGCGDGAGGLGVDGLVSLLVEV